MIFTKRLYFIEMEMSESFICYKRQNSTAGELGNIRDGNKQ